MTLLSTARVMLPSDDLHAAAAMYLAWLAHPKSSAERLRAEFGQALQDCRVHRAFRHQDRAAALRLRAPGDTRRIRRRDFQPCLDRGLDGICRSLTVLHLYHRRQSEAFRAMTGTSAAEINAAMPAWSGVMRGHSERWKALLALNDTGPGTDSEPERIHRMRQRVLSFCSAVLPLAQGLVTTAEEPLEDTGEAIRDRLLEIFLEPKRWIYDAVLQAQLHRHHPYPRGGEPELHPSRLVDVVWVGPDGVVIEDDVAPLTNTPPPRFTRPRRSGPAARKVAVLTVY